LNYSKKENLPRLSGTPPKEGKLYAFPSFGGVPAGRGGHYLFLKIKFPFETNALAPIVVEIPRFWAWIAADSGK